MSLNGETQQKPSPSPLQQQLSLVDTDGIVSGLSPTTNGFNAEFLHCLTQNLLVTTAAGTSGQPQITDTATGASVAAAFGLPIPDVSMMYSNVNLYSLLNFNLLNEAQRNQQHSSFLTEYLKQRTVEIATQQEQQQIQQQQRQQRQLRQQRSSKEKKRSNPCSFQWCELCLREVHSSKLPCHIRQHHVAQPMFICPQCRFSSSYSKNNVKSHMSTVHGLTDEPISHMEEYADEVEQLMKRCFPTVRGRGRPVHNNIRSTTASSSSTITTEPNDNSVWNGSTSVINKIAQTRYTHSYRRRGIKHPAQEISHEIYSSSNKRFKDEHDYQNVICSESTINQNSVNASGQSSPSEEDSSNNISQNTIDGTYIKNMSYSNGTNGYSDHNDHDNNGTNDCNDKYRHNGYQDGTDHTETIANNSSPSSSEHVNREVEFETESNDSSVHDFDEEEQPLGRIDHIHPRYFPQNVNWWVLANDQLKGTIFESFRSSDVLHKFPQQPYMLGGDFSITDEQLKRVQEVRQQLSVDLTGLRSAIYNLDLNALPIEQVDLIANIAPTSMDVFYLLNRESANSTAIIGENEQFLLMLAKIDRIEEKLHAMSFMGHINSRVTEILKSFEDLTSIVKVLKKNRGFRALLRIVLVSMNFIIGDFTAKTIRGFKASDLTKICATELCNSPKTTLLNIVASSTISEFPEVCVFRDTLPALEKASRVNFQELSATVRRLERDHLRFDLEASRLDNNEKMAGYREMIRNKVMEVKSSHRECKNDLRKTMRFFGELVDDDLGPEIPETFFASIATFYRQLQRAWIDVHLHGE